MAEHPARSLHAGGLCGTLADTGDVNLITIVSSK